MPTKQEVMDYIIKSAQSRGIDPNIALKVFRGESGFNPRASLVTPREASYGVTQLNIKGGLGVDALRRGIDPRDPNQWQSTVDFSLDQVRKGGWTPWVAARKAGVGRWTGVDGKGSVDIGAAPTLKQLTPPTPPTKPADRAESQILRQMAPTEGTMARHPGFDEAIKRSMTGNTENVQMQGASSIPPDIDIRGRVRTAGFVPPGLTKGAATTRGAANKNVAPKGTMKDVEGAKARSEELRRVPSAKEQIGKEEVPEDLTKAIQKWNEAHEKWLNGDGPNPGPPPTRPNVRTPSDPDFRQDTALQRTDPNLAAQNDPAGQALIAAKIRGYARPGGTSSTTTTVGPGGVPTLPKAAAAAAAVGAGVSAGLDGKDPAVEAVQSQIGVAPTANVDPGVGAMERQLNIPPGTLSNPNTGVQQMVAPIMRDALPAFQKAMQDPVTRQAAQRVAQSVISEKARIDAMRQSGLQDATVNQRQASVAQMQPGGGGGGDPLADRAMERAIVMDNARRGAPSARGIVPQSRGPVAARPPVPQTTKGTVSVRPTTEEEILAQAIPPGAEKGDQPVTPQPRGMTAAQAYPYNHTPPPGAYDPSGGVAGMPSSGQLPMDPVMMQLMQFFTQGSEP